MSGKKRRGRPRTRWLDILKNQKRNHYIINIMRWDAREGTTWINASADVARGQTRLDSTMCKGTGCETVGKSMTLYVKNNRNKEEKSRTKVGTKRYVAICGILKCLAVCSLLHSLTLQRFFFCAKFATL